MSSTPVPPTSAPPRGQATFDVAYPERDLDRLTSAFRFVVVIPILVVLGTIGGSTTSWGDGQHATTIVIGGTGLLFLPPLLMLLFRRKYPRWWFDFNRELLRFSARVAVYAALLTDEYPSTDEEQSVRLDLPEPDGAALSRWLPLVKWLLAVPHYVVLFFLSIGAFFAVVGAWFAILFTGRYPRGLFAFVVGVARWHVRVVAYAFVLVTDEYPPFRLGA